MDSKSRTIILKFEGYCFVVSVIRITGKSPLRVGGVAVGILSVIIGIVWILASGSATQTDESTDLLNGSSQYAPALIAVLYFAFMTVRKKHPIRLRIVSAALAFTLSLIARTVDINLCETFPHGTHFYWHLLNGLMVGLLLQGLIRIEKRNTNEPQV